MQTTEDKKETDINGYVTYYDVPMTKIGVFPYLGKTISPKLKPDKIYQVLRPREELTNPETLKSLEAIPFINDHTMIGEGFTPPERKGIHGVTGKNVKINGSLITNDAIVYSDILKDLIESGKRGLSMGYRCIYELTSGEFEGKHYDAIQRNIRFNHIALVDEGRMGEECRVTDSITVYDSLDINQKEFKKMAKITLDEALKEEIKEEIKQELLEGGGIKEETQEEIIDEEPKNEGVEAGIKEGDEDDTESADVEDKRKLIDEIGGILEGKVDEEVWRTIMGKAEKLAYKPSETGANDNCVKDDEEEEKEEKEEISMDSVIAHIAKHNEIVSKIRPIIGDNVNYSKMTTAQVVKYACDKLDIKPSLKGLEGYLKASEKYKKTKVTTATDSIFKPQTKSPVITEYLK